MQSHRQRGVTLVEVMVAMLVTTAGLLGFAALQTRALNSTEDGYLRVQALRLAESTMERMRINQVSPTRQSNAAISGLYNYQPFWTGAISVPMSYGPTSCTYASSNPTCLWYQMVVSDIVTVRQQAASMLPQGDMLVKPGCANWQVCVYVAWGGQTADDCETTYTTSLTIPNRCVVLQGM